MVWNEETIFLLRDLWAHGHSTAEIGRRLGVSKNSIVGKAHRLDLTARPSPIRRDMTKALIEWPQVSVRVEGPTLPPLASAVAPPVSANTQGIQPGPIAPPLVLASKSFAAPPVRVVMPSPSTQPRRSVPSCCWPIGEPGKRDFHFCDGPSLHGKPYCEDHAKLAYVKIRDRKDDAA